MTMKQQSTFLSGAQPSFPRPLQHMEHSKASTIYPMGVLDSRIRTSLFTILPGLWVYDIEVKSSAKTKSWLMAWALAVSPYTLSNKHGTCQGVLARFHGTLGECSDSGVFRSQEAC